MKTRPLGVTLLALLTWVAVPWMGLLAVLSVTDPKALEALLRALSPGGSGPVDAHLGMGRLLPLYYVAMTVSAVALALGLVSPRVRAAFRPEAAEGSREGRGRTLRLADRALPWGGLALVAVGLTAWPTALPVGFTALVLAFFAWVAEWNGIALPRPGRTPLRTVGCWETPLAFTVRHRGGALLFSREDDPASGAWSDEYTVHERADGEEFDPRWEALPLTAESGWTVRGRVPAASLRFEHHERVCYVERGSLDRALASVA